MVKAAGSRYEAGRRGKSWRKVKPVRTLDLVVLAAEWGHGRRRGWLSNLHLGARDPDGDGFVMVGKTFKGLTDALLTWQTERLQELAVDDARHHGLRAPRAGRRDRARRRAGVDRATRAAWRCGSHGSGATGPTSRPTTPTPSTRCERCSRDGRRAAAGERTGRRHLRARAGARAAQDPRRAQHRARGTGDALRRRARLSGAGHPRACAPTAPRS